MAEREDESVRLALLAHDLRTPLTAMRLTAELIGGEPLSETQADHLAILVRSIDALTGMTGKLVQVADPGGTPEAAPEQICDIVNDCTGLFRVAAEAKQLTLVVEIAKAARPLVTVSGAELRRIITTLLDNSVKYTASGHILVEVSDVPPEDGKGAGAADPELVRISVTDTGPGIDAEEEAALFQPFARGRQGLSTGPGTGLGLWGAERQARALGGELKLVQPETGGSRFDVLVPISGDGAGIPKGAEAQTFGGEGGSGFEPGKGLQAHVLIVDDNDINCRLLAALLESFGMSCEIVRSGEEALAHAQIDGFDVILLDLNMPGLSGLETAEELLRRVPGRRLPLVAVTASLEAVGEQRLTDAGFLDVVTKPLSPAVLYQALERICAVRP